MVQPSTMITDLVSVSPVVVS